jgi:hypothetical protein
MRDLLLDLDDELVLTNGDLAVVEGSDAIVQDVKHALRMCLGEWFLTGDGVDYINRIFGKHSSSDVTEEVRRVSEARPGISSVVDINATLDSDRNCTVTFTALTSLGTVGPVTLSLEV